MAGPLATAIQGASNKKAAKKDKAYAAQQQRAGAQLINELDYEPMYASENVPTYQRSQSPVARSYLESFLMGNNPSATFSGAPNAKLTKQRQQSSQNAMFGTPEQRIAQQRQMETATPWKVTPPTRKVNPSAEPDGAADWTMQNSELASYGINKTLADALADTGTDMTALNARSRKTQAGALELISINKWLDKTLKEQYGGDRNKLAADIRSAGGAKQLFNQQRGK